jgi:hypothetical protein
MTKQEKIIEAYGEHFETVKNHIDENGWIYTCYFIFYCNFKYHEKGFGATHRIRPKSLAGIEDNNGWIKIESDKDLPKEEGLYFVMRRDKTKVEVIKFFFELSKEFKKRATHYQPIFKPKNPIY